MAKVLDELERDCKPLSRAFGLILWRWRIGIAERISSLAT
jgi:hypothetical protein